MNQRQISRQIYRSICTSIKNRGFPKIETYLTEDYIRIEFIIFVYREDRHNVDYRIGIERDNLTNIIELYLVDRKKGYIYKNEMEILDFTGCTKEELEMLYEPLITRLNELR